MSKTTSPKKAAQGIDLDVPGIEDLMGVLNREQASLKLAVLPLVKELLESGELDIEIPDSVLVGKFTDRVTRLEARVAELEKQLAGKGGGK